jgi:antitoxin FitA
MSTIRIRNLDEVTKDRLRLRAARNNRSIEDEATEILRSALSDGVPRHPSLAHAIADRFKALGGIELEVPPRDPARKPPSGHCVRKA